MSIRPPMLGAPEKDYNASSWTRMVTELRLYFDRANMPSDIRAVSLNINILTLPTQASLGTLASGDVYRDTSASNVLKIKP